MNCTNFTELNNIINHTLISKFSLQDNDLISRSNSNCTINELMNEYKDRYCFILSVFSYSKDALSLKRYDAYSLNEYSITELSNSNDKFKTVIRLYFASKEDGVHEISDDGNLENQKKLIDILVNIPHGRTNDPHQKLCSTVTYLLQKNFDNKTLSVYKFLLLCISKALSIKATSSLYMACGHVALAVKERIKGWESLAYKAFSKANIANKNSIASLYLGICYQDGIGVKTSLNVAVYYYKNVIRSQNGPAISPCLSLALKRMMSVYFKHPSLSLLRNTMGDIEKKMFKHFISQAQNGPSIFCHFSSLCYRMGIGVKADKQQEKLYTKLYKERQERKKRTRD